MVPAAMRGARRAHGRYSSAIRYRAAVVDRLGHVLGADRDAFGILAVPLEEAASDADVCLKSAAALPLQVWLRYLFAPKEKTALDHVRARRQRHWCDQCRAAKAVHRILARDGTDELHAVALRTRLCRPARRRHRHEAQRRRALSADAG